MADKQVTFGIRVVADSNAGQAANSVEALKNQIGQSQDAVKSYNAVLRQLRGSSDEVKEAKVRLKGAIEAEKNAISANALALGKLGTNYAAVVREQKKLESQSTSTNEKTRALRDALRVGGDETRRLSAAFKLLDEFSKDAGLALASTALAAGFLTAALGVGLVAGVAAATVELSKFIVVSGDLLRTQELDREATMGSTENARAFGTQIEFTMSRVRSTREELTKLANTQYALYDATRISGQGIVDSFNAVAVISAARTTEIGNRISEVLSRNRQQGRFGLAFGPQGRDELQGTGIKSVDVAKQLAQNLNISLKAAEQQLYLHRVKLDDGAKAVREVIESRFSAVNANRLISLDTIAKRFHDSLVGLTKDVNVQPFLEDIDKLARNFDVAYVNGQALKTILEALGVGFDKGTPILQEMFDYAIIGALKFEIEAYKIRNQIDDWKKAGLDFVGAIEMGSSAVANMIPGVSAIRLALEAAAYAWDKIHGGTAAAAPIKSGDLNDHQGTLEAAQVQNLGFNNQENDGAVSVPSIHRAPGHAKGGKVMRPAFNEMFASVSPDEAIIPAPQAKEMRASAGGRGDKNIDARVEVTISLPNVKDGAGFARELATPGALAAVTKVFEDMFQGNGVPTQTPAAGVP